MCLGSVWEQCSKESEEWREREKSSLSWTRGENQQTFETYERLWICLGIPGFICSCVAPKRCLSCGNSVECVFCVTQATLRCVAPTGLCKMTHQCCCVSHNCSCPWDHEVPCACGLCNVRCCGDDPGDTMSPRSRQSPTAKDDACMCMQCPGCTLGLFTEIPACIGCSMMELFVCCFIETTSHFVTPTRAMCFKAMQQCSCCYLPVSDQRCACPCDTDVPFVCAACCYICCGQTQGEPRELSSEGCCTLICCGTVCFGTVPQAGDDVPGVREAEAEAEAEADAEEAAAPDEAVEATAAPDEAPGEVSEDSPQEKAPAGDAHVLVV